MTHPSWNLRLKPFLTLAIASLLIAPMAGAVDLEIAQKKKEQAYAQYYEELKKKPNASKAEKLNIKQQVLIPAQHEYTLSVNKRIDDMLASYGVVPDYNDDEKISEGYSAGSKNGAENNSAESEEDLDRYLASLDDAEKRIKEDGGASGGTT
jgi:hypothetical protein